MTDTINQLLETMDLCYMSHYRVPTKIKVKTWFYAYLVANCADRTVYTKDASAQGYAAIWTGIPIEIDDTIESEYYEFVYEEK